MRKNKGAITCQYCKSAASKVTGNEIYPHRPDLKCKVFYLCKPCDAYVGCHPGSSVPLGILANAELRQAKRDAHLEFDRLWKEGQITRSKAYIVLARLMLSNPKNTHIGMMTVEQCKRVIALCQPLAPLTEKDYCEALEWAKANYPLCKPRKPKNREKSV